MTFSEYVRDTSGLDPRIRELTILRIATWHAIAYEIAHHTKPALQTGLSEHQISHISQWRQNRELFEERDQAVLAYVEETLSGFNVSEEAFLALRQFFKEKEIVDLSLVIGWYLLCGALLVPLQIEVEETD